MFLSAVFCGFFLVLDSRGSMRRKILSAYEEILKIWGQWGFVAYLVNVSESCGAGWPGLCWITRLVPDKRPLNGWVCLRKLVLPEWWADYPLECVYWVVNKTSWHLFAHLIIYVCIWCKIRSMYFKLMLNIIGGLLGFSRTINVRWNLIVCYY